MSGNLIQFSPSAYQFPLLIKHLLHAPLARVPDSKEIVYRDVRHTYRTFRDRLGRLATGLTESASGRVMSSRYWTGTAIAITNATSPSR